MHETIPQRCREMVHAVADALLPHIPDAAALIARDVLAIEGMVFQSVQRIVSRNSVEGEQDHRFDPSVVILVRITVGHATEAVYATLYAAEPRRFAVVEELDSATRTIVLQYAPAPLDTATGVHVVAPIDSIAAAILEALEALD